MQRRELIKWIAAVTGSAFVGMDLSMAAAKPAPGTWSAADVALFDEVAETILPRTDTPGAKDARVGQFIARYSAACYDAKQLAALHAGVATLGRTNFLRATPEQRQAMLEELDREAKQQAALADAAPHWFTMCKQLTLLGFFTSEPGATQVARDRPVPGPYRGCIPYRKGETFWS